MRFPFSLTRSLTSYLFRKRREGEVYFPLVLMLEPLHACNLRCVGCGRIREYADTLDRQLTVEQSLMALDECGAPIVSLCGGEPLLYEPVTELCEKILERKKHIYFCTNGVLLAKRIDRLPRHRRLFINVHLDGLAEEHDAAAGRSGVFDAAVEGIRAAKEAGYRVYTNTTLYAQTDTDRTIELFGLMKKLKVDGIMLSPAYSYEAVESCAVDADGQGESIFLSRQEIHDKFNEILARSRPFPLTASPLYLDFLCGKLELDCAAWANPTYNIQGWRGPCYLRGDKHFDSYDDLVDGTDWARMGTDAEPACSDCLVHCGYEPAAVFESGRSLRNMLRMAAWQFLGIG